MAPIHVSIESARYSFAVCVINHQRTLQDLFKQYVSKTQRDKYTNNNTHPRARARTVLVFYEERNSLV